jgi:hypothetical protein
MTKGYIAISLAGGLACHKNGDSTNFMFAAAQLDAAAK